MMYQEPDMLARLLKVLSKAVTDYLSAQVEAGIQAIMIFDTWGGVLSRDDYLKFSLTPMQEIVEGLKTLTTDNNVPIILFTKGGGAWLSEIAQTGCHGIGLDWTIEIDQARTQVGDKVALQGNIDPTVLYGSDETIRHEVKKVLQKYGNGSGHVFNLGHGIQQYVEPEKLAVLVDAVKEFSPAFH